MAASYLAMGNTIKVMTVVSGTIRGYMKAAADYIQTQRIPLLRDPLQPFPLDPRHDAQVPWNGKVVTSARIDAIYKEIDRWSKLPDRRLPLTINMIMDMINVAYMLPLSHRLRALTDWACIGIYIGIRSSEYLQHDGITSDPDISMDERDLLPDVFIPKDFRFYANGGRFLTHKYAIEHPTQIAYVSFTWRWQKNKMNAEFKNVVRNHRVPARCPVEAALRIIKRFRLCSTCPLHTPWLSLVKTPPPRQPPQHYSTLAI